MARYLQFSFILIFTALLSAPFVSLFFPILPDNKNIENRELANYPDFPKTIDDYTKYTTRFDAYFNDNFRGRNLLFDLNISLKTKLGSKPFKDDKLLIGSDGWYFSNFQKVIDDYRAVRPFTISEISSIISQLKRTKEELSKYGVNYYLLIVPNKHTIYHDKLPKYIKKVGQKTRFEQLIPALNHSGINFIDIRNPMLSAKNDTQLYFKTDSHWNLNGSFIGYTELFNEINTDYPSIKPYPKEHFSIRKLDMKGGDIVSMMGKQEEIRDSFIEYKPKDGFNFSKAELGNYELPSPKIFSPEISVSAFFLKTSMAH